MGRDSGAPAFPALATAQKMGDTWPGPGWHGQHATDSRTPHPRGRRRLQATLQGLHVCLRWSGFCRCDLPQTDRSSLGGAGVGPGSPRPLPCSVQHQ